MGSKRVIRYIISHGYYPKAEVLYSVLIIFADEFGK